MMNVNTPKVSVTVVTFNHGEWLAECLESIVTQETDFPFEVIVGDDASTDLVTREVLRDYSEKFPEIVIPVFRTANIGPGANYFDVVKRARGAYIAHIDGDDMMFPEKLQRQAVCLDNDSQIAIVAHAMEPLGATGHATIPSPKRIPRIGTVTDLIERGCYFCHSSKMYRKSAIISTDAAFPIVDYYLHLEHANSGKILYLNDTLGGHRLHASGISRSVQFSAYIHDAYESAFRRAEELGIDSQLVNRGRIRHCHGQALSALAVGDLDTFAHFASIAEPLRPFATPRQRFIGWLSKRQKFANGVFQLKQILNRIAL